MFNNFNFEIKMNKTPLMNWIKTSKTSFQTLIITKALHCSSWVQVPGLQCNAFAHHFEWCFHWFRSSFFHAQSFHDAIQFNFSLRVQVPDWNAWIFFSEKFFFRKTTHFSSWFQVHRLKDCFEWRHFIIIGLVFRTTFGCVVNSDRCCWDCSHT